MLLTKGIVPVGVPSVRQITAVVPTAEGTENKYRFPTVFEVSEKLLGSLEDAAPLVMSFKILVFAAVPSVEYQYSFPNVGVVALKTRLVPMMVMEKLLVSIPLVVLVPISFTIAVVVPFVRQSSAPSEGVTATKYRNPLQIILSDSVIQGWLLAVPGSISITNVVFPAVPSDLHNS